MMQVEYRLKLGQDEFTLKAEVKSEKEFFEKMSFFSSLPKTGPNGEVDLKLTFRTTTEGHKYYSLVSEKAGMEFKFGQAKENNGGGLFPKGWEPIYRGEQSQAAAGAAPIGAPQVIPQPQTNIGAPIAMPQMAVPQPVAAPIMPQAPVPQPIATQPVQPAAPAAPANPQVQAVANDVLARFGIKK